MAMTYDAVIITGLLLIAAAAVSPLGVWFLYLALCWIHGGMTVGMRAWKIILLADHGTIDWKLCAVRFTVSIFSAFLLGAGFAWSLIDGQKRSWHDMASRSGLFRHRD
jgi:uncharacterized RDD family membrane protein YckC